MSTATAEFHPNAGNALKVQLALSEYAEGRLSLSQTSAVVKQIKVKPEPVKFRHKVAFFLVSLVFAMLVPAWARHQDDC